MVPVASAMAMRSGPACETTTVGRPVVEDRLARPPSTRAGQGIGGLAARPVDPGLAVGQSCARSGARRGERIEGQPLGDPEVRFAPRRIDFDRATAAAVAIDSAVSRARRDGLLTMRVPGPSRSAQDRSRDARPRLGQPH